MLRAIWCMILKSPRFRPNSVKIFRVPPLRFFYPCPPLSEIFRKFIRIRGHRLPLGKPVPTIIDEFLEKFQTAFDPPPPPLFWEKCCDFFQNYDDQHWICNEIFWIGNDPPPISKFFRKFMTKSAVSNAKKIATKFFGSETTPPIFQKIIHFWNHRLP